MTNSVPTISNAVMLYPLITMINNVVMGTKLINKIPLMDDRILMP